MNTPTDTDSQKPPANDSTFTPSFYEFHISSQLSPQVAAWFEGMTLTFKAEISPPQTIIRGYIVDQAALYGLIDRARDLGLTLISVKRLNEEGESERQTRKGDASDKIKEHLQTDKD